ncbi:MAG: hypothetical protein M0D57_14200 [Sphingobacteriales bacterium JAD_PAG50586_3]|nr:MAG: hypothetical protein M0D57_14200 [Sphingobacteriales bacterium JAD_PAG50586_3]
MKKACFTLLVSLIACNSNSTIDKVIKEHDQTDFSIFKNKYIHFRSVGQTRATSIYFVGVDSVDCSPYGVEVNNANDSVISINNKLVISSCGKDYMTNENITQITKEYLKYNFALIKVDNYGNVFINPDKLNEEPNVLRHVPSTMPLHFNSFKHYSGNWYLRN